MVPYNKTNVKNCSYVLFVIFAPEKYLYLIDQLFYINLVLDDFFYYYLTVSKLLYVTAYKNWKIARD
jgi:hypothetical protein